MTRVDRIVVGRRPVKMSVAPQDDENLIGYFSPHPPGNFHAVRASPSLDAGLVGSVPTGSGAWIFRSTVQEYNGMGVWGALAQVTLDSFGIEAQEGNAWICIKNADGNDLLILASGKVEECPVPILLFAPLRTCLDVQPNVHIEMVAKAQATGTEDEVGNTTEQAQAAPSLPEPEQHPSPTTAAAAAARAAEAEAAAKLAAATAAAAAAEAERARLAAEAEKARIAADAEKARIAAEQEQARLEEERRRAAEKEKEAAQKPQESEEQRIAREKAEAEERADELRRKLAAEQVRRAMLSWFSLYHRAFDRLLSPIR